MKNVYSVSQVNNYIKNMFTRDVAMNHIYLKGEVSNCKYHSSGHIYFTLKDSGGQMACVMFAGQRKGLSFHLTEGQSVIALGNISIYERDGKYQLYVQEIILDGTGILYEKYEELKKKLDSEGLFHSDHKKRIPYYSHRIGIVTAKTGAAIQDIQNIAARRNPYVELILYPAQVQGDIAAETIVKGIKTLDHLGVDVIIIGRGGGSIEDLWAFNEESVARAIYSCKTPIISAVGHETDTTISDYVSDLRAPTPSAAAELAVVPYTDVIAKIIKYNEVLNQELHHKINNYRNELSRIKLQIEYRSPIYQIRQKRQRLIDIDGKLQLLMSMKIRDKRHQLAIYMEKMKGLSPINKLNNGYAYITDKEQKPLISIDQIKKDETIHITVKDGVINANVEKVIRRRG